MPRGYSAHGGVIRGSWYGMGRVGFGDFREDMRRQLQLGALRTAVGSASSGRYGVAYGESGYRLALGRTRLTPYVNLQYAQIRHAGFNEAGGYGRPAGAGDRGTLAGRRGPCAPSANGGWPTAADLIRQTHALWQQSFGLRGDVFEASFTGLDQFAPLGGVGLSRYGGVVGSTLDWRMTPRASVQLGCDQYLGQAAAGDDG